jgi:hypothetical protein
MGSQIKGRTVNILLRLRLNASLPRQRPLFVFLLLMLIASPLFSVEPHRQVSRASDSHDLVQAGLALLGTPYGAGMLVGSMSVEEKLVLRKDSLDCMSFLDHLLAGLHTARGCSLDSAMLTQRYFNEQLHFLKRHHFFSDWLLSGPRLLDVGSSFHGVESQPCVLNQRDAKRRWIEGLPTRERTLQVVPGRDENLAQLRNGDLIGFRSRAAGLDVSHVGLVIVSEDGEVDLLHASSQAGKVLREPLREYALLGRGFVVFRLPTRQSRRISQPEREE